MKIKTVILISFMVMMLAACTSKPPPFEERVIAPPDTLVGVIEPLDQIDIYREGTHQLRNEEGKVMLIQSSTINLNRYVGKEVTLQGEPTVSPGSDRPVFNVSDVKSFKEELQTDENKKDEVEGPRKGPACGGTKKLPCKEGFLCELLGSEEDASGVCVPLEKNDRDPMCPFIPPPDCPEYKPGALSKSGCPTRFVCVREGEEGSEVEDSNDLGRVMDTITKYKKELLGGGNIQLIQFEANPAAPLMAVVYETEEKKYKKLFEYSPSGPEFNFTEKAVFRFDLGRWVLVSGEDLQKDEAVKTIYVGE